MHAPRSRRFDFLSLLLFVGALAVCAFLFLSDPEDSSTLSTGSTSSSSGNPATETDAGVSPGEFPPEQPEPLPQPAENTNQLVFIDKAFTTLSRWQAPELRPLLAPSTTRAVDDEQLQHVLTVLQAKLGGLVSYDNPVSVPTVQSGTTADHNSNGESLRSYKFVAHYTEGDALVSLVLQEMNDGFSLYHFDIQMQQG